MQLALQQVSCELRDVYDRGGRGIEARLYLDGDFVMSQRLETMRLAEQWAARKRRDLEREGWRIVAASGA